MADLGFPGALRDRDDPAAKWGTPGVNCYCCTGTTDFCEFCDEWVGKCWCWDDDKDDDEDDGADD